MGIPDGEGFRLEHVPNLEQITQGLKMAGTGRFYLPYTGKYYNITNINVDGQTLYAGDIKEGTMKKVAIEVVKMLYKREFIKEGMGFQTATSANISGLGLQWNKPDSTPITHETKSEKTFNEDENASEYHTVKEYDEISKLLRGLADNTSRAASQSLPQLVQSIDIDAPQKTLTEKIDILQESLPQESPQLTEDHQNKLRSQLDRLYNLQWPTEFQLPKNPKDDAKFNEILDTLRKILELLKKSENRPTSDTTEEGSLHNILDSITEIIVHTPSGTHVESVKIDTPPPTQS